MVPILPDIVALLRSSIDDYLRRFDQEPGMIVMPAKWYADLIYRNDLTRNRIDHWFFDGIPVAPSHHVTGLVLGMCYEDEP